MKSPIPLAPVALADGEQVVLSGGRSWHVWLFTAALLPSLCMLIPLAALPWLFSGRYWLTQRRLIWKPMLGKVKEIALKDITAVDVVGKRSTITVRGPQGSFSLRLIQGWSRLWGALVLFRQVPVPQRISEPRTTYRSVATMRVAGKVVQDGFGIVHAGEFVFLPREKSHHLGADGARVAGQLALALIGVSVVRYQAELPFDLWLSMWSHLDAGEFSELLREAAERRGGQVLPVRELQAIPGKHWLRHPFGGEFRPRAALLA